MFIDFSYGLYLGTNQIAESVFELLSPYKPFQRLNK